MDSDDKRIELHDPLNKMVWDAAMAALQGLCSAVELMKLKDPELLINEKHFQSLSEFAHLIGLRTAMRHFAWVAEQPSIDEFLRNASDTEVQDAAYQIARSVESSDEEAKKA